MCAIWYLIGPECVYNAFKVCDNFYIMDSVKYSVTFYFSVGIYTIFWKCSYTFDLVDYQVLVMFTL